MLTKTILLCVGTLTSIVFADTGYEGHEQGHNDVHYRFEYGVHDPHTHDIKTHYEHRNGDHVEGQYTLVEPDGTKRIVKYRAGPHTGFEAFVEKVGHAQHSAHYGHKHQHHGDEGHGGSSYIGATHWGNQGYGHY